MSEWDCGTVPEVFKLLRISVADPLDFPVGDVTGRDDQHGDHRVNDLVCVSPPGAVAVGAGKLHVQLIGDTIDNHDEVSWPSAIKIRVNFGPFPSSQ